jgi:two-component system, NarL family, response regulator NreC
VTSSPQVPAADRSLSVALAIPEFPVLRAAYRSIVGGQPDLRLVADVESRGEVVGSLAAATPDVVIAECGGDGGTGCAAIAAVEELRAAVPSARLLVVDCRCGGEQFATVMRAGADGFLDREAAPDDVLAAVRCVGRGGRYVSPAIVTSIVNRYVLRTDPVPADDAYESLGDRAREVFRLAATGHTNREIARALHISEQTVHSHRAAIMERLGLHDRVDLVKYALRRGLIEVAEL